MKESIITPKYAVLSSEEFWCHVLDPKTQGWIWERSAECVGSSNRTVILRKKKMFCRIFWCWSTTWDDLDEFMLNAVKMKVWASSIEHLSFFSSQLIFCVHHVCFASMRTAPVTSELLSSSRYGIAHSHKPFSSLCAFKICTPTGFWKLNEGLLHL